MYPNEIADYFDKWEYKPKAVIPGAAKVPKTVINDPIANAIENRQAYSPSSTSVITQ